MLLIWQIVTARVSEDHLDFYHAENWTSLRVMIKICCLSNDQSKTMLKFFKSPGADLLRISNELQLEFIIEKVCWQRSNYEKWSNCNCKWFQLENLAIDGVDHDWWTGATDAGHEGTWTWDDQEDHDNLYHQDHHENFIIRIIIIMPPRNLIEPC